MLLVAVLTTAFPIPETLTKSPARSAILFQFCDALLQHLNLNLGRDQFDHQRSKLHSDAVG
jgi:hypothetical protein